MDLTVEERAGGRKARRGGWDGRPGTCLSTDCRESWILQHTQMYQTAARVGGQLTATRRKLTTV